jgi:hypothetical protein
VLLVAVALAGCGGAASTPASGSPGSSPAPAATVDGTALAASFVRILSDPELRASVIQQATATSRQAGDVLEIRVTMTADLALPDVALELTIEAEGQATRFGIVVVGDRSFVDLGEGWLEAPAGSLDTAELTDALVVVSDPGDLAYAGSQVVDGRTLHHLVAARPLPYSPAGFEGTGAGSGTLDDLDAYVEADGTPVRIELSFTADGSTEAGPITVIGTTTIEFRDVGGAQVIVAPPIAPSSAP